MMPRLFGALIALTIAALGTVGDEGIAKANEFETPPEKFLPVRPVSGGWFREHSNLGNINFDISDTGIAAGNWSTYRNGKPIWYYFQGEIQYKNPQQALADGVIAIAELPLLEVTTGGPCLTCDYVPPVFNQNGKIRLEFTSTRTARFIHNDSPAVDVVAWMQGNPLFEKRDYSGDWLVTVSRRPLAGDSEPEVGTTFQTAVKARVEPLLGPETYSMHSPSSVPSRETPIEPGARRYTLACSQPSECAVLNTVIFTLNEPCLSCIPPSRDFLTLFFNADEIGELVGMTRYPYENDPQFSIDDNQRIWKAYGSEDRILIRYSGRLERGIGEPAAYTLEIEMHRLPTGLFSTPGSAP